MGNVTGSMRSTQWTPEEAAKMDTLLRRGATMNQIARAFPERSRELLRNRAKDNVAGTVARACRNRQDQDSTLRAIQARLCELLHARGANWEEPLWPNGPSPADLERQPWPTWAAEVRLAIARLDTD